MSHLGENLASKGFVVPAPAEAWAYSDALKMFPYVHYEDGIWDSVKSNNILQHFATAFLPVHLKGETDKQAYLDVVPRGSEGVYSVGHSAAEARFLRVGRSVFGRVLVVAYTQRKGSHGEAIRVISARRASRKERTAYGRPAED